MRVLILGEGPTDLGRIEPDGNLRLEHEGVLPILVRALIAEVAKQTPIEVSAQMLGKKPRLFPKNARRMGRSKYGYANRLRGLLALPVGRRADAVVVVVDRDGKDHKDRIVELNLGRAELLKANKPCAVGVAVEMIEAWLLADEQALRTALADPSIQRQPHPESLTAHDEASDRHPKTRLEQLMEKALGRKISSSDFPDHYAAIARAMDLRMLEDRCPEGFQPFAEQVRELPR